jgi:hypothetical protein
MTLKISGDKRDLIWCKEAGEDNEFYISNTRLKNSQFICSLDDGLVLIKLKGGMFCTVQNIDIEGEFK